MILQVVICGINSYTDSHCIRLDDKAQFSALLGPNGAGKSTFLDALAFISAEKDLHATFQHYAYVEITLTDSTRLKRVCSIDGKCFVNDVETDLEAYISIARARIPLFIFNMGDKWRHTLANPRTLLDYIENLAEEGYEKHGKKTYYEALIAKEKACAETALVHNEKLRKLRSEVESMKTSQETHDKIMAARKSFSELKTAIEARTIAIRKLRVEEIDEMLATQLTKREKLIEMNTDHEVVDKAAAELHMIKREIANYSKYKTDLRSHLKTLLSKRFWLEFSIQATRDYSCMFLTMQASLTKTVVDHLKQSICALNKQLEHASQISMPNSDTLQWDIDSIGHQLDAHRELKHELGRSLAGIDAQISSLIQGLEASQDSHLEIRRKQAKLNEGLLEVSSRLKQHNVALQRCNLYLQADGAASISLIDDSGVTPQHRYTLSEDSESLTLLYRGILGGILQFVWPISDPFISKHQIKRMLNEILDKKREIPMVVESDDDAVDCARRVSTYHSKRVVLIPRYLKREMPSSNNAEIPAIILDEFPSVRWLSSMLRTKHPGESHLAEYVAGRFLVVPNSTAVDFVVKHWIPPSYGGICDISGYIHFGAEKDVFAINANESSRPISRSEDAEDLETYRRNLNSEISKLQDQIREYNTNLDNLTIKDVELECQSEGVRLIIGQYDQYRNRVCAMSETASSKIAQYEAAIDFKRSLQPLTSFDVDMETSSVRSISIVQRQLHSLQRELHQTIQNEGYSLDLETQGSRIDVCVSDFLHQLHEVEENIKDSLKTISEQSDYLDELESGAVQYESYLEGQSEKSAKLAEAIKIVDCEIDELQKALEFHKISNGNMVSDLPVNAYLDQSSPNLQELDESSPNLQELVDQLLRQERNSIHESRYSRLQSEIKELTRKLQHYENIVAVEFDSKELDSRYAKTLISLQAMEAEAKRCNKSHAEVRKELVEIRKQKLSNVNKMICRISPLFESVYRSLYSQSGNLSAQTYFKLVNDDDIDQGIALNTIPAGKPFCRMAGLSGGEFTLASMAFQIAIALALKKSVWIIDECDANLDEFSSRSLAQCLAHMSGEEEASKIFVATHRRRLYNLAHELIGVFSAAGQPRIIVTSS